MKTTDRLRLLTASAVLAATLGATVTGQAHPAHRTNGADRQLHQEDRELHRMDRDLHTADRAYHRQRSHSAAATRRDRLFHQQDRQFHKEDRQFHTSDRAYHRGRK